MYINSTNQTSFKAKASILGASKSMSSKERAELKAIIKGIGNDKDHFQINISPTRLSYKKDDIMENYSIKIISTINSRINEEKLKISRSIINSGGITSNLKPYKRLKEFLIENYQEKYF